MEFFKPKEIQFYHNRLENNNVYKKGVDEDTKAGKRIKQEIFKKTNEWARRVSAVFSEPYEVIEDNRWNTSGYFKRYSWARLFPKRYEEPGIYFSLGVNGTRGTLFFKLECQRSGSKKLSEELISQFDNTLLKEGVKPLELSADQIRQMGWDQLLATSAEYAKKNESLYLNLVDKLSNIAESTGDKNVNSRPYMHFLNQILYGPPGTGKTYQTKNIAVQILDGKAFEDRAVIKSRYNELYKQGRIRFMTFHQGTTYEDFIEGIKPTLTSDQEEEDNTVSYNIEDGVFKQVCVLAAQEYVKRQPQEQSSAKTLTFSQLYDELVSQYEEQLERVEKISIPLKSGSPIHVVGTSSKGNLLLKHEDGQREYTASKGRLEKLFNAIDDFDNLPNIYSHFREIIGGSNASANWAVLNQIYKLQKSYQPGTELATEKTVDYADKKRAFERIDWSIVDPTMEVPSYLLIIDEINRGNVAAILGELITLLEPDKRGGTQESLEVTLPYSKSNFAVPPNVYVIGTMNTADRSVEALDTALRRRFSFTEVGPRPKLLSPKAMIVRLLNESKYADLEWEEEPYHSHASNLYAFLGVNRATVEDPIRDNLPDQGERAWGEKDLAHLNASDFTGVQLDSLLEVINNRIRMLIDKDHMIGHAYFMGIWESENPLHELKQVFRDKLLPLLQEYFYGNFGKIQLVLGRAFVEEELEGDIAFAPDADYEGEDYNDRKVYLIKEVNDMSDEDFRNAVIQIYTTHG